jgi:hypothetical protein
LTEATITTDGDPGTLTIELLGTEDGTSDLKIKIGDVVGNLLVAGMFNEEIYGITVGIERISPVGTESGTN